MTRRTVARGLLLAALAAPCGGLLSSAGGRPAAPAPPPAKWPGPLAALTVRPQALLSKLGLSAGDVPLLRHFQAKVGVPLERVDTFAVFELPEGGRAVLVRTTRRLNLFTVNVVNALQAMTCTVDTNVYLGHDNNLAVHFPDQDLKEVVIADSLKTMERLLPGLPALRRHLDRGRRHDLTVWARALPAEKAAPGPGGQPWRELGGYMPVPGDAREVRLAVDAGQGLEVRGEMTCASGSGARTGARPVRTFIDLIRVQMLQGVVVMEMDRLAPREHFSSDKLGDWWPLGLLSQAERGLNAATVRAEGRSVRLHARIDVSGKELGRALAGFAKGQGLFNQKRLRAAGPGLFFGPQKEPPRKVAAALAYPALPAPSGGQPPTPPAAPTSAPAGPTTPPGPPRPDNGLPPLPIPRPSITLTTLTVANVRKEAVLLFTVDPTGELTFQKQLPHGEAADLPARTGQRWAAVFQTPPYRAHHRAEKNRAIWLIR